MARGDGERAGTGGRVALGLIGAGAGATFWLVIDLLPRYVDDLQAYLFLAAFVLGSIFVLLALVGPLRLSFAVFVAPVAALPPALLLAWASTRHDAIGSFFARPEPAVAYAILLVLPLPYLIAAFRPGTSWRDYPTLFAESWSIVVRLSAAGVFAGIAWLAVFLADELLALVDIELIAKIIAVDWVPPTFTGLVSGLALSVLNEMRDLASANLVLRLLRLLILPALLVVGLFVGALPVQGLGQMFGLLSPAATLIAIALLLALLVSSGVDARDETAARSGAVRLATRLLALLLPIVALLALEALRRRYLEVGLSPARVAATAAAGLLLLYGLCYAASALGGRGWMRRIRAVNSWLALLVILAAGLWLTPILNAERLSAEDQVARLAAGRVGADEIDLWTLTHDWGRAGQEAVARIEALAEGHPDEGLLRQRIAHAAQAPDRFAFWNRARDPVTVSARSELLRLMPVVPESAGIEVDRYVLPWYAGSVAIFLEGCRDRTQSGRPGCVLVVHDLVPDNPGDEAILFFKSFGLLRGEVIVPEPVFRRADAREVFSLPPPDYAETDRLIEALQDGGFSAGPARINAITIGERQFTVPY